ncbi:hypothetical protein D3C73_962810 [compost metagenome]
MAGGSIESVGLAGRTFSVAADADSNRKLGGWENETQPNGDGTGRLIKTRVAWLIDGLTLSIDDLRGDQEYLQDLKDRLDFFPIDITYASGAVYSGLGQVTGEEQTSSMSTTAAVTLSGPGKLTRQ